MTFDNGDSIGGTNLNYIYSEQISVLDLKVNFFFFGGGGVTLLLVETFCATTITVIKK